MDRIPIAINGFGRIGRLTLRALLDKPLLTVKVINDLTDAQTLAHLLKYDSIHGRMPHAVRAEDDHLHVGDHTIRVMSEKDPARLPWGEWGIHTVLEATGRFTDEADASAHLQAGAKRVVISAPAKGNVPAVVLGVNEQTLTGHETIISNGSCTTNCLALMAKVLDDAFGIREGLMSTIHAYTQDQRLQDAPHHDLRRARAAALSIIPTSTGAAKTIRVVMPTLDGRLDGMAFRVPVPCGSVTDLTVILNQPATRQQVNDAFRIAAATEALQGFLQYETDPIVSADIVGNTHSCIFDSELTMVSGSLVKVVGWYDNETGYSHRTAELLEMLAMQY